MKKVVSKMVDFLKNYEGRLYLLNIPKNIMKEEYMKAFPDGTNPIRKEKPDFYCNTCFQFMTTIGKCITNEGKSIFSYLINDVEFPFNKVFEYLSEFIEKNKEDIDTIFLSDHNIGHEKNIAQNHDNRLFYHFHFPCRTLKKFYSPNAEREMAEFREEKILLKNILEYIIQNKKDIKTVLEYIDDGLYRGEQYKSILIDAINLAEEYQNSDNKILFIVNNTPNQVAHIKRHAIWVFIDSLVKGDGLQKAEQLYLKTVSPENYQRVKSLTSKKEVEKAIKFLKEKGLADSIPRKHANISEIPNEYILWEKPKDVLSDIFEGVEVKENNKIKLPPIDKIPTITFDELIDKIQKTKNINIILNNYSNNFICALSTAKYPNSKPIFKWNNHFGWTFKSGLADGSIVADKVKQWGGNINAKYRVSLLWFNNSDYDLHMKTPNGAHIYYGHKQSSKSAWQLDIDMNVSSNATADGPIENIFTDNPEDGVYKIWVHNYNKRNIIIKQELYIEIYSPNIRKILKYPLLLDDLQETPSITFEIKNGEILNLDIPNIFSEINNNISKLIEIEYVIHHKETGKIFFTTSKNEDLIEKESKLKGFFVEFLKPELKQFKKTFEQVSNKAGYEIIPNGLVGFGLTPNHPLLDKIIIQLDNRYYRLKK